MKTVALFGGSFSPVHLGHLAVARGALERGLADEVWFIPCRRNPLKDRSLIMPDETRIDLIKKAIKYLEDSGANVKILLNEIELDMPEPSYTVNTLRRLSEENPNVTFRLLVGADSYLSFDQWKEWQWIVAHYAPIIFPRPGYPVTNPKAGWTLIENVDEYNFSSSNIRKAISDGNPITEYCPWITDMAGEKEKS